MDTDLQSLSRYHRRGDADAFGALVRDHAAMVFATARRVTGNATLAEDVSQETFLELARSGQGVESVAAWLHRVAWRKACNVLRSESRRRKHEQAAAEMRHDHVEADWDELEPQIDAALSELPPALRDPLVQHHLEGRTQQEIAARLGVSQSTVSRQLETGIKELRSRLRSRGVICGAGLAVVLSANTAAAAPASLTASLGKLAISGVGASNATASSALMPASLLVMSTTTKALLLTAVIAVVSIPIALYRSPAHLSPDSGQGHASSSIKETSKVPVVRKSKPDDDVLHYRPAPVSLEVSRTVDGILERLRGLSKEELAKNAELNALTDRFIAVISAPEMQAQIAQRIAAIQATGRRGTLTMDFAMLHNATGRAWLEATVSNDAQRMNDWVLNTLDGAVFEYAVNPGIEQTAEGVKWKSTPPAKSGKQDERDE